MVRKGWGSKVVVEVRWVMVMVPIICFATSSRATKHIIGDDRDVLLLHYDNNNHSSSYLDDLYCQTIHNQQSIILSKMNNDCVINKTKAHRDNVNIRRRKRILLIMIDVFCVLFTYRIPIPMREKRKGLCSFLSFLHIQV